MALTDTIQCDGVTTAFTLTRAVTTKESLSLTIASGASAGLVVSPSDYTFSPVNSVSQSVTITWANAVNYGTVGTPVDVTVAIYHNPGADPADTLLYSYDSASAMRPELAGRDMEHIIDLVKMVIGGADLATTSLGDQEDDIAALDVRLDAAEATIVTHTSQIAVLDGRLDTAESDIVAIEAVNATQVTEIDNLESAVSALNTAAGFPNPFSVAASAITISDAGAFFSGGTVELALQQLGYANRLTGTATSLKIGSTDGADPAATCGIVITENEGVSIYSGTGVNEGVNFYTTTGVKKFSFDSGDSDFAFYDDNGDPCFGGTLNPNNPKLYFYDVAGAIYGYIMYDGAASNDMVFYAENDIQITAGPTNNNVIAMYGIGINAAACDYIDLPSAAGTTGAVAGRMYYDTGTNKVYYYNGTTSKEIATV